MTEKAGVNWVESACTTVLVIIGQVNWEICVGKTMFMSLRNTWLCQTSLEESAEVSVCDGTVEKASSKMPKATCV